jgi:hypothetical protein
VVAVALLAGNLCQPGMSNVWKKRVVGLARVYEPGDLAAGFYVFLHKLEFVFACPDRLLMTTLADGYSRDAGEAAFRSEMMTIFAFHPYIIGRVNDMTKSEGLFDGLVERRGHSDPAAEHGNDQADDEEQNCRPTPRQNHLWLSLAVKNILCM